MKSSSPAAKSAAKPRRESTSITLAVAIAVAWCVLLGLLSLTSRWQRFETRGFDELTVITAPNRSSFPITIIGVDEASFNKLQLQWPWPRSLHAELVERLTKAGAAVIVFDLVFTEPSSLGKKDDQRFADAIKHAGNVVLAANQEYRETDQMKGWLRYDPLPLFTEAGAQTGLAIVELDPDQAVRTIPDNDDALWRVIVRRLKAQHPEIEARLSLAPGSMVRYIGADHTIPYVSYHEVVKPTGSIPDDFFKDQIVIIGFDVKATPDVRSAQSDLFGNPFLGKRLGSLMPGAEIHANFLETALAQNAVVPVSKPVEIGLLVMIALACAFIMRAWRPVLSALAGIVIVGLLGGFDWWLFSSAHTWLPAFSIASTVPAMYVSLGGVSFLREQARRREVTSAFSLYVTPQVVNQLLSSPDGIKLGGERREVTFMFTDLAGFTSFSEALSAEKVVSLLNRHFTLMTDIILQHDGTVARFIGDAIMAFWGAPLDDDKQASRAVNAAIEMQEAMARLREELAAEGLPEIRMRIGIQSGPAVIGNIGSAKRLEYTAIGDDVNLAARLEGTNKLYGTGIMIGDATARQVMDEIRLRRVDKVIVKGRSQAVETFTPCADNELIRLNDEAIRLFRAQSWDESARLWRELLVHQPDDRIAGYYLERIAEYQVSPPQSDWDGAVALDKL